MNGARNKLFPGTCLAQDERGGIGWRDAIDHVEYGIDRRAAADDLLEIVFAEDFFAQVDVFPFELCFEMPDLLVLAHVLDRERQLVGDLLQQFCLGLAVLHGALAAEVQRADALAANDQRHHDQRTEALSEQRVFARIFALVSEVRTEERTLMQERPSGVAVVESQLEARHKVIRWHLALGGDEPQNLALLVVEEDRAAVEPNHRTQRSHDRLEQRIARQVEHDGVVDREQCACAIGGSLKLVIESGNLRGGAQPFQLHRRAGGEGPQNCGRHLVVG